MDTVAEHVRLGTAERWDPSRRDSKWCMVVGRTAPSMYRSPGISPSSGNTRQSCRMFRLSPRPSWAVSFVAGPGVAGRPAWHRIVARVFGTRRQLGRVDAPAGARTAWPSLLSGRALACWSAIGQVQGSGEVVVVRDGDGKVNSVSSI